jgi:phosphoribosylformimino-5-aminoimidazole carboxamide ribotide isomerase
VQIIPVIDVLGGIVVHASGGVRAHYQPLQSIITSSCDPIAVISALLTLHDFKKIYIADLDAIRGHNYDLGFYAGLHKHFPLLEFYLDLGIRNRNDWQKIASMEGIRCVLGSESLEDIDLLKEDRIKEQATLSLDYQNNRFLGKLELVEQPENWPKKVIVMNLDYVGARSGPDFSLLAKVQKLAINSEVTAAGGVRNETDLVQLAKQGITATLVASALHKGNISSEELKNFETGHRPLKEKAAF